MSIEPGTRYEKEFEFSFDQVLQFARLTGDVNPIHLNRQYAEARGFKSTIVHGFLVGSAFSQILGTEFPGEGTVYLAQSMSFRAPVFPGERLVARIEVVSVSASGKYTLRTDIVSKEGRELKVTGEAVVLYRE